MCVCTYEAMAHHITVSATACELFLVWIVISLGTIAIPCSYQDDIGRVLPSYMYIR